MSGLRIEEVDKEDLLLIKETLEGKKTSFAILVKKYEEGVFNLALRLLGNWQDAEDVTQEAFLRAYENLENFKVGYKFQNWLYTITLNLIRNRWRKEKSKEKSFAYPENMEDVFTENPEDLAIQKEKEKNVEMILSSLPWKEREIIVLKYIEGFTYEEIASLTGLPVGTVKTRCHRAKEKLYKRFKKEFTR